MSGTAAPSEPVLILGGGLMGLAVAHQLARKLAARQLGTVSVL